MLNWTQTVVGIGASLLPLTLFAQPPDVLSDRPAVSSGLSLSAGIDSFWVDPNSSDFFLRLTPKLDIDASIGSLSLVVPLRYHVDRQELRKEDWDEFEDYLATIDAFSIDRSTYSLFGGRVLDFSLGHGTLVHGYRNDLDLDLKRTAIVGSIHNHGFRSDFLSGSVTRNDLVAAHAMVQPLLSSRIPLVSGTAIGVSWVNDFHAPENLAAGTLTSDSIDAHGNVRYDTQPITAVGIDAEIPIIRSPLLDITPYTDLNRYLAFSYQSPQAVAGDGCAAGGCGGFHYGLMAELRIPAFANQGVQVRLEGIRGWNGYIPRYFDQLYDVEKFNVGLADTPRDNALTKLGYVSSFPRVAYHGLFFELAYHYIDLFEAGFHLQQLGQLGLEEWGWHLAIPTTEQLRFSIDLLKKSDERVSPNGMMSRAVFFENRLAVKLSRLGYLTAAYARRWEFDQRFDRYAAVDTLTLSFWLGIDL